MAPRNASRVGLDFVFRQLNTKPYVLVRQGTLDDSDLRKLTRYTFVHSERVRMRQRRGAPWRLLSCERRREMRIV